MSLPEAADTHLYPRETVVPPHVAVLSRNMQRRTATELYKDYPSSYDFKMSMMMRRNMPIIDVSNMHARNTKMMRERGWTRRAGSTRTRPMP